MSSPQRMLDQYLKRKNPWVRECLWERGESHPDHYTPDLMYYLTNLSRKHPKFSIRDDNAYLDIHTKKAALSAASSVVALLSYTGEQELNQCSGVIIENDDNNAHIVLTSANLIRHPTQQNVTEDSLADSLKVIIYLYNGGSYEGEVCAYDFHYNIAWIRFQSDSSVPTARLRQIDDYINANPAEDYINVNPAEDYINVNPAEDYINVNPAEDYINVNPAEDDINVNPAEDKSLHLRPYSSHFNLVPGQSIVAVGRYFAKPFDLMAAPVYLAAILTVMSSSWGLARSRCGEGGALINLSGEVIGIIFYYEVGLTTPFLPINIAHKCWEHFKRYGGLRRPSLGVVATNFYAANIYLMEKVIQKIPGICNGVLVEKVIQGSSADSAGMHLNDVIVQCGGETVHSFLEFLEMVCDTKVGDALQLSVVRASQNDPIHINMVVDEIAVEKFNRWPRN